MGRRYSEEFKEQAVRQVLEGEATIAQIARDLRMDKTTLAGWKRDYCLEHGEPAGKAGETVEAELARTKRELARVRLERDILKKAISIFSQEPRGDTDS